MGLDERLSEKGVKGNTQQDDMANQACHCQCCQLEAEISAPALPEEVNASLLAMFHARMWPIHV